jgi:predicted RNA-binding protein
MFGRNPKQDYDVKIKVEDIIVIRTHGEQVRAHDMIEATNMILDRVVQSELKYAMAINITVMEFPIDRNILQRFWLWIKE